MTMLYYLAIATIFGYCVLENSVKVSGFMLTEESIQELQSVNPSVVKEIAYILLDVAKTSQKAHKRNSEIINSLLGLPKVLNDAGR